MIDRRGGEKAVVVSRRRLSGNSAIYFGGHVSADFLARVRISHGSRAGTALVLEPHLTATLRLARSC